MKKLQAILVGVDFSDSSLRAVKEAGRLSLRDGAELHVVHSITPEFVEHYRDSFESPKTEILEKIRTQLASFASSNLPAGTEFAADVFIGNSFDGIAQAAEKFSVDLVVLGSHGLTVGAQRIGNVASKCVRKLAQPVLLVRDAHQGAFKTVVAAIDLSDSSGLVLDQAATIAAHDAATLHVLHVHCPPWLWLSSTAYGLQSLPRKGYEDEYRRTLEDHFSSFITPLREQFPDLEIKTAIVEDEATARAIRAYLSEEDADLGVIGSHGRGGLKALFLGTTAERMITDSPCSVLTVKANIA